LQLQTSIAREAYNDIDGKIVSGNRAKQHDERIGNSLVTYLIYPNGKVIVSIACSNRPFKIDSDTDEINLFSYLGQVRDRLIHLLSDIRETIVPPITEWVLKECDVNKDMQINGLMQLTLPDIQLKQMDRVFRLYVKSLGESEVYRVEESLSLDSPLFEALQRIRAPKISEQQLLEHDQELLDIVLRLVAFLVYNLLRIMLR
jgi:hypothetical protein